MDLVLLHVLHNKTLCYYPCFNPYFNGSSTSTREIADYARTTIGCFNPYFNGSSTSTLLTLRFCKILLTVSILILMDLVLILYSHILFIQS